MFDYVQSLCSVGALILRKTWHISLVLVSMVLGILLATSFNTQQKYREALDTPRKQDLIKTVQGLERERDRIRSEIEGNRKQLLEYEASVAKTQGERASYTKALENTRQAAGLDRVKGPGLIVTLGDSTQISNEGAPNNYVIHDYDLRTVVNSLWAGGAKAISINGHRLITTSSIRCAGPYVLVNSNRLSSPFKIRAVGNVEKLKSTLHEDVRTEQLLNDIAKLYSLVAIVEESKEIVISGYTGGLLIENARVIEGGGD